MSTICKLCGKHKELIEEICQECRQNDRESYVQIREFLLENPHANILEIVQATGLDISTINKLIKEGRLVISNRS